MCTVVVADFTQATRAEPGCLCFDWSRSLDDPAEYVLIEAFRDVRPAPPTSPLRTSKQLSGRCRPTSPKPLASSTSRCPKATGRSSANYPIFTTGTDSGTSVWQQGGPFIPGTKNTFGGTSTTEYGPLLSTVHPTKHFKTVSLFNNFNSGDIANPCPH